MDENGQLHWNKLLNFGCRDVRENDVVMDKGVVTHLVSEVGLLYRTVQCKDINDSWTRCVQNRKITVGNSLKVLTVKFCFLTRKSQSS